jgi:hypothetical protein
MAGDTTFTFLDAAGAVKTARAGSNVGGDLAPSAVLYDVNGNVLIGQKTRAGSIPMTLSVEDIAALAPPAAITGFATSANQTTEIASLASILAKLSADPATQTTLAAILAKLLAAPATEAKQDTGNTSLSSIDGKTPALGQQLAAASRPLVLTAAQITTLTPPAAITGFATQTTLSSIDTKTPALGAAAAAASTPVTLANDGVFAVNFGLQADAAAGTDTGSFSFVALFKRMLQKFTTQLPAALGGTIAANSFPVVLSSDGPFASQTGSVTETAPATDTASSGLNGRLQRIAQRITSLIALLPAALVGGRLDVNIGASGATVPTKETRSATPGQTSVVASATTVTVLASNANRLGATIFNDGNAILYLKLGATASTTSYSIQVGPNGYYEVPFNFTGIIDGIWSSATGNARITELTA